MTFFLILLTSMLSCGSQLCQKQATRHNGVIKRKHYVLLWLGYSLLLLGCAMLLWLWILQQVPIGMAYPMLSLNFIFVTFAAHRWWQERITLRHSLGIVFIVVGVIMLAIHV